MAFVQIRAARCEWLSVMAKPDFEATWHPRIGKDAAEDLRRARKTARLGPLAAVFAVGAGALIGRGAVGDAIGVVLALGAVVYVWRFIRAQWRTASAVSAWFGVKQMRWLPRMTPERFDEWRQLRGLMTPGERPSADR